MNTLNIDEAISYVNKIVDNVRCAACDKLEGLRVRYPCGHSACDDCIAYIEYCPSCTPRRSDALAAADWPLTHYAQHVTALYNAVRKLFDPDAQRKRLSEQLKIEKALFPKCIQAPVKYENKRKSMRYTFSKENRYSSFFPGEAVFSLKDNTMEKSDTYVQRWLNKNEKEFGRKPFSDLNVNMQRINNLHNKSETHVTEKPTIISTRKRSHFKTASKCYSHINYSKESIYQNIITSKRPKKHSVPEENIALEKCDNDESGVFMDNEPIVIEDSQHSTVDKDKEAWLAVLEAHKHDTLQSSSSLSPNQFNHTAVRDKNSNTYEFPGNYFRKVPFIKKSAIIETCKYCKNEIKSIKSVPTVSVHNKVQILNGVEPVNISINTNNFSTTITIITEAQNKEDKHLNTVGIQTDNLLTVPMNSHHHITHHSTENVSLNICNREDNCNIVALNTCNKCEAKCDVHSEDLFIDDKNNSGEITQQADITGGIVIEESDSDTDLEASGPRSVQVDVHKSCEDIDYGILTEVVNVKQHESKDRRGPRGYTPTSTDSSEKENYNPNREKRHDPAKKKQRKK